MTGGSDGQDGAMDSGSVFVILFVVILLAVLVAALVARSAGRRSRGSDEGAGEARPGDAGAQLHQDPDPDRMAGGRSSTHGH